MARPVLEVADIFRGHGPAWRKANAGHMSLGQLKVMSAIERCRTAALGGHVARCEDCSHTQIAYNSCRNRHCPKCQGAAAKEWLAERAADLLPVPYYHVVFTLPAPISDIAYQNKGRRLRHSDDVRFGIFARPLPGGIWIGERRASPRQAVERVHIAGFRGSASAYLEASLRLATQEYDEIRPLAGFGA